MTVASKRMCVFGAGAIGCYVGGRLAASGARVSFVGRERLRDEVARHGLKLTDYRGADMRVAASDIRYVLSPNEAASADLVLVTVKSAATAEAGETLAAILKPGAVVVSFQNGIGNDETLRRALPGCIVLAGMVPFNVIARGEGAFHQGTEGALDAQDNAALKPFLTSFKQAGLPLRLHADMRSVQWAKLLLNLNNAINALSGLPLREELSRRDFRRCLVLAQKEAFELFKASDIKPAKLTPLPPNWIPSLLRLPDGLFRIIAARMLAIDPLARSSMADDLAAGRRTEIDWINGEIVALARKLGRNAPVNQRLVELIRAAEQGGRRDWSEDELLKALEAARPSS